MLHFVVCIKHLLDLYIHLFILANLRLSEFHVKVTR